MISWLIGSKAESWYYLKELLQDYRNVGVYVNEEGEIELVKVSDLDDFFLPTGVLIHPRNLRYLKPFYLKLEKYVAFPLFDLRAIRKLVERKGWRAVEYYLGEEFQGGWVVYDCEGCEEKQRLHLEVGKVGDPVEVHLQIYGKDMK
ncbi:MAG: hypothetical protein MPF33_08270 [Candidatus Aramenus sp.]|jgi:hypothetical protein|nr:hypothetical protein [Candidatus Aramenus sp.]